MKTTRKQVILLESTTEVVTFKQGKARRTLEEYEYSGMKECGISVNNEKTYVPGMCQAHGKPGEGKLNLNKMV